MFSSQDFKSKSEIQKETVLYTTMETSPYFTLEIQCGNVTGL